MTYKHRTTSKRYWYCTVCGETKSYQATWCCIVAECADLRFNNTVVVHPSRLIGTYLHDAWWSLPEPPFKAWRP